MRLALAQYALDQDPSLNLAKVLQQMHEASLQQADMIIFPELCLSPFFPQFAGRDASRYAMTLRDERIAQIQAKCRQLRLTASPNVYLQEGQRRFDASLVIDADGEIRGISKMVHIAQVSGFYEQDYYAPSDTGFRVYETTLGKIGIVVCFDRHYPESTRTCALRGAQLIIIPTANRMDEPRDLFEAEVRTAAMQNGVYIAMCNRVGREEEAVFCGESIVVDLSQVGLAQRNRPYLPLRCPAMYER